MASGKVQYYYTNKHITDQKTLNVAKNIGLNEKKSRKSFLTLDFLKPRPILIHKKNILMKQIIL